MEDRRHLDPRLLAGMLQARAPSSSRGVDIDQLQAKLDNLRAQIQDTFAPACRPLEEKPPERAQPPQPQNEQLHRAQQDLHTARQTAATAQAQCAKLREKLRKQSAQLDALRSSNAAATAAFEARLQGLEANAARLAAQQKQRERRDSSASQGTQADLSALRQRLAAAEHRQRQLHVLCTLPDGDRRDAVLHRHRQVELRQCPQFAAPEVPREAGAQTLHQLSMELQAIRAALSSIHRTPGAD